MGLEVLSNQVAYQHMLASGPALSLQAKPEEAQAQLEEVTQLCDKGRGLLIGLADLVRSQA